MQLQPPAPSPQPLVVFTIGHSTRPLETFIGLLRAHGVTQLADIRSIPRSKRHPHFAGDALSASLPAAGIAYRHFPGLGGHRKPRRDSPNTAWRHEGFRGYADYMQTDDFKAALDDSRRLVRRGGDGDHVRGSGVVAVPPAADGRRARRARRRRRAHHVRVVCAGPHAHGLRARHERRRDVPGPNMRIVPRSEAARASASSFDRADEHDRAVRRRFGAAGHPGDPVRSASLAVDFVCTGRGRHGRKLSNFGRFCEGLAFWAEFVVAYAASIT